MTSKHLLRLFAGSAVLIALILPFSCGRSNQEQQAERMAEEAIESQTGGQADVDMDKNKVRIEMEGLKMEIDEGGTSWPAGIPREVPKPRKGKIVRTSITTANEADTWSVIYERLVPDDLDAYESQLKKAGFKTMIFRMGEGGTVSGRKDQMMVNLIAGKEEGVLTVVNKKTK